MVDKIVLAACCLHNLLTQNTPEREEMFIDEGAICDGNGLTDIGPLNRNPTQEAIHVREAFKNYFRHYAEYSKAAENIFKRREEYNNYITDPDDDAMTSSSTVSKTKKRKYDESYISFGFVDSNGSPLHAM
ncbi:hypothetical protein EVAR_38999_1 [Eumeta japonica]|uniref:DDE Tnp4 domain-containing protein n=1 Tax=Eumeta variegata TaxID=151549 RepID=A0A4C1WMY8_EUMVA|nr:hypothetical protein EVAR_38999_1 [Eumeta japonica]